MGSSKLDLPFKKHTIIEEVINQLSASKVNEIILVTGAYQDRIQDLFADNQNLHFVHNSQYQEGMTTSIQCGVSSSSAQADAYLICLGDLPFITTAEYNQVIDQFNTNYEEQPLIIRPFAGKIPAHPVLFSKHFKQDLTQTPFKEGAKEVLKKNSSFVTEIYFQSKNAIRDIDTPEAYIDLLGH